MYLNLITPDGSPLARAQNFVQHYAGILPVTGDYDLSVETPPDTPAIEYALEVLVTYDASDPSVERIVFPPGATSLEVQGVADMGVRERYGFCAKAGQTVTLTITTSDPNNIPNWALTDPDGQSIKRIVNEDRTGAFTLVLAGNYRIDQAAYTLTVESIGP